MKWTKLQPVDGDPLWRTKIGDMNLDITVACPWIWEWSIDTDRGEMGRGSICVGTEEEQQFDEGWNYQEVEKAQARCLAVANGILLQRVRDAWGIPGIGVSSDIDMDGSTSWRCNHPLRHGTRFLTSERPSETKALLAALEAAP